MDTEGTAPRWASQPAAQREGIAAGQLVVFLLGTLFLIGAGVWGASAWFRWEVDVAQHQAAEAARYPELRRAESHAQDRLRRYGIVNEAEGVFQIPVARAMEVLAQEEPPPEAVLTAEVRY